MKLNKHVFRKDSQLTSAIVVSRRSAPKALLRVRREYTAGWWFSILSFASIPFLSGCVYSLHPYNVPASQTLKIIDDSPQDYVVRVDDSLGNRHVDYPVTPDGLVSFQVPSLPRGCAVRLFGLIRISDYRAEDVKAFQLSRDGKTVRKLSLDDISNLPLDSNGVGQVKLE
jgi:hypothetical protein